MMKVLHRDEVIVRQERRHLLWRSDWLCDVLCAILVDPEIGKVGMEEVEARCKVVSIMTHLGLDPFTKTTHDWTTKPYYPMTRVNPISVGVIPSGANPPTNVDQPGLGPTGYCQTGGFVGRGFSSPDR